LNTDKRRVLQVPQRCKKTRANQNGIGVENVGQISDFLTHPVKVMEDMGKCLSLSQYLWYILVRGRCAFWDIHNI